MVAPDTATARPRADYGIDAPTVIRNLVLGGAAAVIAGLLIPRIRGAVWAAAFLWGEALYMWWSSRVGKLRQRDRLMDRIQWRGGEQVLDIGCGRGLLLLAAAKRIPMGRAVGVDLWQNEDLSDNNTAATLENARREGVEGRVELHTADMRELPFPDRSFDVILSSFAVHNVYDAAGRARALQEMARVLKPRGRVVLQDFRHTAKYVEVLRAAGLVDVRRSGFQFLLFPPARVVEAVRPANNGQDRP